MQKGKVSLKSWSFFPLVHTHSSLAWINSLLISFFHELCLPPDCKATAPICVVDVASHNDISSCGYGVAAPLRLLPICWCSDVVDITPHLQDFAGGSGPEGADLESGFNSSCWTFSPPFTLILLNKAQAPNAWPRLLGHIQKFTNPLFGASPLAGRLTFYCLRRHTWAVVEKTNMVVFVLFKTLLAILNHKGMRLNLKQ